MMMNFNWVVGSSVVSDEESPPSPVAVIGITTVKKVTMEIDCIPGRELHINQRQYLQWR